MRKHLLSILGRAALLGGTMLAVLAWPGEAGLRLRAASIAMPLPQEAGVVGTALAVAPGALVTNSHVVRACAGRPLRVVGLPGPWQVRAEDEHGDLAVLRGPAEGHAVLPLSGASQLPRGTPVLALGYASGPGQPATLLSTAGQVLRAALTIHEPGGSRAGSFVLHDRQGREVAATWDDGLRFYGAQQAPHLRWRLEIDAAAAAGSSGGPVLDGAGNVVGVIYAGDSGRSLTAVVPLDDLRELLRRTDVLPRFGARSLAAAPDWPQVARRAAAAVFQLRC